MVWLSLLGTLIVVLASFYTYTTLAVRRAETQFPPSGKFVSVDNLQLHYVCQGSGSPVVLVHGNPGFLQNYSPAVLNSLAENHQVYAIDRPGHGYSEPLKQVATPLVEAQLLQEALPKLGIEKPVLVGHSWGAALVLASALQYPHELSGIVLVAPLAYEFAGVPLPPARIAQAQGLEVLLKVTPSVPLGRFLIRKLLASAFSPAPVPQEYLETAQALWTRPHQVKAMFQNSSILQPTLDDLSPRYSEIDLPVVIVTGDRDSFIEADQNAYRLHKTIAHAQLIVLPDVGHAIPQVQPDAVVDAVHQLLQCSST